MKVGIILNRVNFEEKQIIQVLESNGHKVEQLNNQQLILPLNKSEVFKKDFGSFDVILQRSLSLSRSLYRSRINLKKLPLFQNQKRSLRP